MTRYTDDLIRQAIWVRDNGEDFSEFCRVKRVNRQTMYRKIKEYERRKELVTL